MKRLLGLFLLISITVTAQDLRQTSRHIVGEQIDPSNNRATAEKSSPGSGDHRR